MCNFARSAAYRVTSSLVCRGDRCPGLPGCGPNRPGRFHDRDSSTFLRSLSPSTQIVSERSTGQNVVCAAADASPAKRSICCRLGFAPISPTTLVTWFA